MMQLFDVAWPSLHGDLSLGDHMLWKFSRITPDLVQLVTVSTGCQARTTLKDTYIPVLACFDLEYWQVMDMDEGSTDILESRRSRLHKKYMHNLRHAFVKNLFAADKDDLKNGSWDLGLARAWSIRTWNRCSHSEYGRSDYNTLCQKMGKTPYTEKLTVERRYSDP
jgi:hypothetical protein